MTGGRGWEGWEWRRRGREGRGSRGDAAAACGRRGLVEISCAQSGFTNAQSPKALSTLTLTLHDCSVHAAPSNIFQVSTPRSKHQPRSWSKAEAWLNIRLMFVTLSTAQPLMSWSKAEASLNIDCMLLTL